jgi:hypothetical protein
MMLLSVLMVVCLTAQQLSSSHAAGSGRAFPIDSENYVTKEFQNINPKIEWDPTNFLVDLAGHYANCKTIGTRGAIKVDKQTPEGEDIVGGVDYAVGSASDVDSVNRYIQEAVNRWMYSSLFDAEIRGSSRFGCSVRPGCSGQVAISCLFSGTSPSEIEDPNDRPGSQTALAFTPEQYTTAEIITGNRWDRSHFLENLSGYETDCAMIGEPDWPFSKALHVARDAGVRVLGTYGHALNRGSTPDALDNILRQFKSIQYAKKVGCSLIPDCVPDSGRGRSDMYVVVSCLYEEN